MAANLLLHPKRGKMDKGSDVAERVVVAVKASKEIPRTAIVWALTHVVQPGDCITLLVVVPAQDSGRKLWGFPRFSGDCSSGHKKSRAGAIEMRTDITDSCSQMMLQLHDVYDPNKINVKVKVVSGSPCGTVAAESKRVHASWVVLDKHLKHEEKRCMEELQCNIVIMKRSQPKVLRLNLAVSSETEPQTACTVPSMVDNASDKPSKQAPHSISELASTPTSSPEVGTSFTYTEAGTSSASSSDPGASPFSTTEMNVVLKKEEPVDPKGNRHFDSASFESDSEHPSPSTGLKFRPWMAEILGVGCPFSKQVDVSQTLNDKTQISTAKALLEKYQKAGDDMRNCKSDMDFNGNVREAISMSRDAPPGPPLCSICKHKAPVFGKPPRWFSYAELELATGGFSQANFLAEGGFGSVHRGVLADGQAVAVKQHKLASSQGDHEFCSEVEVLSCAQHRNVVMLIGFCVEDRRRLLVYEYICNGSLDSHLYGRHRQPLEWSARQKIAVGAARGLRYLHEECRVGCIVHRDMRPNNILITHDFEPLVGDFGLARWQPNGDLGVDTRVIGTFGYLAPEYAQSGQITEKADVYSFGVVLIELVTGRKAVDINRPKGQQCLTEWARPLLEECTMNQLPKNKYAINELVDPRLANRYSEQEVYCMLHTASLCISRDPNARPRMSQVLRILEGDTVMESNYLSSPSYGTSSMNGRILGHQREQRSPLLISKGFEGKVSCGALRATYWGREKARHGASCD